LKTGNEPLGAFCNQRLFFFRGNDGKKSEIMEKRIKKTEKSLKNRRTAKK